MKRRSFSDNSLYAALLALALTILALRSASAQAPSSRPAAVMDESPSSPATAPESSQPSVTGPTIPTGRVISVRLEPPLPGEDPWTRVGLQPGVVLDLQRARQALRNALASGTFAEARASVRTVPGGLELLIRGERRVRVREVAFVGVAGRTLENVRADFGIADGSAVTDADVARAAERLRDGYHDAGWASARVSTRWRMTDDPATRVLIVTVDEGRATMVRNVVLQGVPADVADAVRAATGIERGQPADPAAARRALDALGAAMRRGCASAGLPAALSPDDSSVDVLGGRVPVPRASRLRDQGSLDQGPPCYLDAVVQPPRFVSVGPALVDAVISVVPGDRFRIEWVGVEGPPSRRRALTESLRLSEERGVDATTLNVLVNRVRDWYVRRAHLDVRVRAEVRSEGPGRAVLRFTVDPGPTVAVREVSFPGAVHVDPAALREIVRDVLETELSEREPLGPPDEAIEDALDGGAGPGPRRHVPPEQVYVPELYAEVSRRVVARFREQGFLDAAVAQPELHRERDARGNLWLDVTLRVTEGPRTLFEEVVFQGNHAIPSARLLAETSLRLGVPLSRAALDEARTAMVDFYREQGYLFARIEPQVDRSPDRTRARVRFEVHEGPLVRVGRVFVRGNGRTRREIILERVALRSGQIYRPSAVRNSQRRLIELGIFSGVSITPADPEVEAPIKDVLVQVFELRPQLLEVRAGFSTGEGVRAGFEYGYRNLGGTGTSITLRAQAGYLAYLLFAPIDCANTNTGGRSPGDEFACNYRSLPILGQIRRRLSLSFAFPALPLVGPDFRATVDLAHARLIERQFAIDTTSASGSLIYRPARAFSLTFTQELQTNSLDILGNTTIQGILRDAMSRPDYRRIQQLLLLPEGTTTLTATRVEAIVDLRDQVFNPQRGWLFSLMAEYVHILGSALPPPPLDMMGRPGPQPTCPEPGVPLRDTDRPCPGNTFRGILSGTGYFLLPFGNIVFASNLRLGRNFTASPAPEHCSDPNDPNACVRPTTYTNRLFFMGGADSMRAWIQDTFIPEDVIEELQTCDPLNIDCTQQVFLAQRGGNAFINWRSELRIPVGQSGLALGVFLDLGNLWKNPARFNPLILRAALGIGARYTTPIGPLALDVGFNPNPRLLSPPSLANKIYEIPFALNFSIGIF